MKGLQDQILCLVFPFNLLVKYLKYFIKYLTHKSLKICGPACGDISNIFRISSADKLKRLPDLILSLRDGRPSTSMNVRLSIMEIKWLEFAQR